MSAHNIIDWTLPIIPIIFRSLIHSTPSKDGRSSVGEGSRGTGGGGVGSAALTMLEEGEEVILGKGQEEMGDAAVLMAKVAVVVEAVVLEAKAAAVL